MIDSYQFGKIIIDGNEYTFDVIIYRDNIDPKWRRKEGHSLSIEDINAIIDKKPEMIIIGTCYFGLMKVPSDTIKHIESYGITVISDKTSKVCEVYNSFYKIKSVIALLHLTC